MKQNRALGTSKTSSFLERTEERGKDERIHVNKYSQCSHLFHVGVENVPICHAMSHSIL